MGNYAKNTECSNFPVTPIYGRDKIMERITRERMSRAPNVDSNDAWIMDMLVSRRARCKNRIHWAKERKLAFSGFDNVAVRNPKMLRWAK